MNVNKDIKSYVDDVILPNYEKFDKAHNLHHVNVVIEQSLCLSAYYPVDINMVYVIAAYHDLGLSVGRDVHHIESGKILSADPNLKKWFSEEQIVVMKEAVEDHRASNKYEPRSIYGKIVAEADRVIDMQTVLRRTVQFGLDKYPNLSREEHFLRFKSHLIDKYSSDGYLKLWIPYSDNASKLKELQSVINDDNLLKIHFNYLFDDECFNI